ncbi:MAG: hypothetical protein R3Y55_07390 [Rikenellaceae bacterium]
MKTADWPSVVGTQVLLIGENSTLQWKDEVLEHAMFLDYYFRHAPYDLGERSRYSEARTIFESLEEMTSGTCRPEQVHGTLLSNDILARPPRGKHIFVPEKQAREGLEHINSLLKRHPSIKYIFVMGLQTNYYLQKFGFYPSGDITKEFIRGAEPRHIGVQSYNQYYQPVNAKPFRQVCFKRYRATHFPEVEVIPILPVKSYPLAGSDLNNFGESFEELKKSFIPQE